MKMHGHKERRDLAASALLVLLLLAGWAYGKKKTADTSPFIFLAGTDDLHKGCGGKLEVLKEGLAFTCPSGSVTLPFSGITVLQYRPDVSKAVMDMKIPWKVPPQLSRVRENKYFTVVCNDEGKIRAMVLQVDSNTLIPYLAEIELRSGKTVQVWRSYDEFQ